MPGHRRVSLRFLAGGTGGAVQNGGPRFRPLAAVLLLAALAGCSQLKMEKPTHTNPADPESPGFVEPGAELTAGPDEGATVTTSTVTFRWRGLGAASQYQRQVDTLPWSDWLPDTSATLSGLQEGTRRFRVRARDAGGYVGSVPATRYFTMNSYSNTVMIYPLQKTVYVGDTVQFVCVLEDMAARVSAVEMRLYMQNSRLDTIGASADTGYHWRSAGGTPVGPLFSAYGLNYLQVALGAAGGSPAGVTGSGRIFKIKAVAAAAGSASVQMILLTARDTLNQPVTVSYPPNAVVTVLAK